MTTLFRSQSISIDKGSVIAGRYEVVDLVGTGGMGVVLRVIDRDLNDEVVALKILHSHLAQDKNVYRRFRNEVLVARSLTHPNIVRIHDIGRAEEGKYSYISMEFVDGVSLKERLQTVSDDGEIIRTPLPFDEAISVLYQILSGVSYAHGKGIIHRDLKPANVMISKTNEIKLADFGMARILSVENSLTQAGQMLGTPDYMSPEQIRGETLDAACDIYALGIVGYELVVGSCPFQADSSVALAFKHLSEPIPPFAGEGSGIPKWFEEAVFKATAKAKEDRFASVFEFASVLVENAHDVIYKSGALSIDGTRHLSTSSLGRAVKSPVTDTQSGQAGTTAGTGTKRFELGPMKAGEEKAWSLQGGTEAQLELRKKRGGGLLFLLTLLLAAAGGAGYWFTIGPGAGGRGAAGPGTSAQHGTASELDDIESELNNFNPGRDTIIAGNTRSGSSDASTIATSAETTVPLVTTVKAEPPASTIEPSASSTAAADSELPRSLETTAPATSATATTVPGGSVPGLTVDNSTTASTVPLTTTPPTSVLATTVPASTTLQTTTTTIPALAANLVFKERGAVVSDRTVSKDRLREITFSGTVSGLSVSDRSERERIVSALSIGLLEAPSGRLLSKPGFEPLPGDSAGSVKLTGGVGGSILPAGDYKLALNFSGKTLAVRPFSIEEFRATTTLLPTTVPPAMPPGGSLTAGLPPPLRPGGEITPTSIPGTPGGPIGSAVPGLDQPPAVQHESYGGNFIIQTESGADENHGFSLEVDRNGEQISGTATIAGIDTFQVTGQILPRGIELHLNGSQLGARLSGGKREGAFKGRFTLSDQRKGSWEVRRTN